MGKRSQAKMAPRRRRDTPTQHTWRRWICTTCRRERQLIACADGRQRCPRCKQDFDRDLVEQALRMECRTPAGAVPANGDGPRG